MKEKIHLIGIGGIGLSGLGQILHEQGNIVTGSDIEDSHIISSMQEKGIKIAIGHDYNLISKDLDKIVYSSAIPNNNIELKKAKELGVKTLKYAEAIKEFTENSYTIAICGTHGKTTVTAFSTMAMLAGEKDPTVIIGSSLREFGNNNYRLGQDKYFIVEACEYKRNFLNYSPNVIILTNLEAEHLDYYKDLEDYKNAFKEFIAKLPEDGYLIANGDDENVLDVIKDAKAQVVLFTKEDERLNEIELSIPGDFNKLNALCGLMLGQLFNIDREKILEKFKDFKGAWRRYEILGKYNEMIVINDYAHHPTAIKATIEATKEKYPDSKICCVFQPHQYNRTKNFLNEFAKAFKGSETVILPDIYKVRDKKEDIQGISIDNLVDSVNKNGSEALKISDYEEIKEYFEENHSKYDVLLIMGAGDIWKLGEYLFHSAKKVCINCED